MTDRILLFYLPNNLKMKNFEKMKKAPADIIALHLCTITENHMCGSWKMQRER